MKRIKLFLSMALLTIVGNAFADNLVVEDFTVAPGTSKTISIELVNPNSEYIMVEFWLSLPEGVSIPMDDDGFYMAEGNSSRFTRTHTLEVNKQDGFYHFLAFSSRNVAFMGKSGEFISVTLEAASNAQAGTYTAKIFNQLYNDPDKKEITPEDVTFNITIGNSEVVWFLLDEDSPYLPDETDTEVDIKVKRTINANEWSTLCLPFDMTEDQVEAAFGEDVQLAEFTSYDIEENNGAITGIYVYFTSSDIANDGFIANYPYLIKTSKTITEFTVKSTVIPDEDNAISEYAVGRGKNRHVYGTFYGTLRSGTKVPNNSLFISNNKFYYSKGKTEIKAFRGYFTFEDVLSDVSNSVNSIAFSLDETNVIHQTINNRVDVFGVYDLQGRRIDAGTQLKKGIYIIDGKKKVIK